MTLEELYGKIGGDYEEAVGRLRMEKLISKFVIKFLDDQSCNNLFAAWENGDDTAAFEASHAAKGVSSNLAFNAITGPASKITEALRPGNEDLRAKTDVDALVEELKSAYAVTVEEISAYRDSL